MKPDDAVSHRTSTTSNVAIDSSFESTSNPPGSHESFSIFGDTACGEPLQPQRLMLDFTPNEDLDNDYVQRKCCAFWDFLQTRKDLHKMMVVPDKNLFELDRSSDLAHSSRLENLLEEPAEEPKETTAVSMLEFVEGKGLIDRTFEAKLPQSMCSLGSREYRENETSVKPSSPNKEAYKCSTVCKKCRTRSETSAAPSESTFEVQLMCSKMQEWDKTHPQSMEPPGHPPALSHCVMQRKVSL